ncbi:MAG TPA: YeiH family putative sulfate export transporter [Steroidobacteraceae bacterium]|nr:YeiH family putative sulfate export transporter [Steroidobacteraceae bacterium]
MPGICLTGAIAILATELCKGAWMQAHGVSALTLAIVGGMIVGNTAYPRIAASSARGVLFSKQILLRAGIILFGLRLTFQDIGHVGVVGVIIDALVLSSTFSLACWAGTRFFGLNRRTAMLIGAGSSICGAAAVMATEPVVRGRAEEVTVAVSTVVAFGTLAIFVYPALYRLNAHLHLISITPFAFGIYTGSTVHEVAQVVAAGKAVAETTANTAVITKLVRVMMLAPFLVMLSAYLSRNAQETTADFPSHSPAWQAVIPWFALGFIAVAGFNSFALLPQSLVNAAIDFDTLILATAMAALGVSTQVSALRLAGIRPLGLAALLFGWLIVGGFAINSGVSALFGRTWTSSQSSGLNWDSRSSAPRSQPPQSAAAS